MFIACRRGAASLRRFAQSSTLSLATRPKSSGVLVATQPISKAVSTPRHLSISAFSRSRAAESYSNYDHDGDGTVKDNGPLITEFAELSTRGLVHPNVIHQITEVMGHKTMTPVQTMTINETLNGTDVIAQARTGTGKTLGFLVPVIQNIIKQKPDLGERRAYRQRSSPIDIRAIVMSPTRELAEQIAVEARKLTRDTGIIVQTAVGGSMKGSMLMKMQREGCHLLVATPGRLYDILTDPRSRVEAPNLGALVLDEADRLLDSGFADDIEQIIDMFPDRRTVDRQTLLFSATIPRDVMALVRRHLKNDFQFVQTVDPNEPATHEKVPQKVVNVGGVENLMPALVELCQRELEKAKTGGPPFKALVYFSSTANVDLTSQIFEALQDSESMRHPFGSIEISSMHGKLTQQGRTRVSDRFRAAKSAIMVSSDVTARGMDFPNVSHVIQVGLPPSKDQYIHRIGRTGRADKAGEGWLLIPRIEMAGGRSQLRGLPLTLDKSLEAAQVDMTRDAQLSAHLAKILQQVGDATKLVGRSTKAAAYFALIGTMRIVNDKQGMVDAINQWTRYGWGWPEPPAISSSMAGKLGLARLSGMNIRDEPRGGRGRGDFDGSWGAESDRSGSRFASRDIRGSSGRNSFGDRGNDRGGFGRDGARGSSGRGRGGDGNGFFRGESSNSGGSNKVYEW